MQPPFLSKDPHLKMQGLMRWSKLKQEQLSEAILVTKESVLGFIKRQAQRDNWEQIEQILKGKPMTKTARFLFQELRDNIVGNLILRLGLRRVIAVGLASLLLPIILAKVAGEVVSKIKK